MHPARLGDARSYRQKTTYEVYSEAAHSTVSMFQSMYEDVSASFISKDVTLGSGSVKVTIESGVPALTQIQEILAGEEWDSGTLNKVADVLRDVGLEIEDCHEEV